MTYQGRKLYTPAKYRMRVKGTLDPIMDRWVKLYAGCVKAKKPPSGVALMENSWLGGFLLLQYGPGANKG